jgi:hypothetical protein
LEKRVDRKGENVSKEMSIPAVNENGSLTGEVDADTWTN